MAELIDVNRGEIVSWGIYEESFVMNSEGLVVEHPGEGTFYLFNKNEICMGIDVKMSDYKDFKDFSDFPVDVTIYNDSFDFSCVELNEEHSVIREIEYALFLYCHSALNNYVKYRFSLMYIEEGIKKLQFRLNSSLVLLKSLENYLETAKGNANFLLEEISKSRRELDTIKQEFNANLEEKYKDDPKILEFLEELALNRVFDDILEQLFRCKQDIRKAEPLYRVISDQLETSFQNFSHNSKRLEELTHRFLAINLPTVLDDFQSHFQALQKYNELRIQIHLVFSQRENLAQFSNDCILLTEDFQSFDQSEKHIEEVLDSFTFCVSSVEDSIKRIDGFFEQFVIKMVISSMHQLKHLAKAKLTRIYSKLAHLSAKIHTLRGLETLYGSFEALLSLTALSDLYVNTAAHISSQIQATVLVSQTRRTEFIKTYGHLLSNSVLECVSPHYSYYKMLAEIVPSATQPMVPLGPPLLVGGHFYDSYIRDLAEGQLLELRAQQSKTESLKTQHKQCFGAFSSLIEQKQELQRVLNNLKLEISIITDGSSFEALYADLIQSEGKTYSSYMKKLHLR